MDELTPELKDALQKLVADPTNHSIVAEYSGANDEGDISYIGLNKAGSQHDSLEDESLLKDLLWNLLMRRESSFELNDGGSGTITFNLRTGMVNIEHLNNSMERDTQGTSFTGVLGSADEDDPSILDIEPCSELLKRHKIASFKTEFSYACGTITVDFMVFKSGKKLTKTATAALEAELLEVIDRYLNANLLDDMDDQDNGASGYLTVVLRSRKVNAKTFGYSQQTTACEHEFDFSQSLLEIQELTRVRTKGREVLHTPQQPKVMVTTLDLV